MRKKEFKHKSCQQLYSLYLQYKDELGQGVSMNALLWKAIGPSVPELLSTLDNDEALLAKVKGFLQQLLEAMETDTTEAELVEVAEQPPEIKATEVEVEEQATKDKPE